jgi:hypothetical protein
MAHAGGGLHDGGNGVSMHAGDVAPPCSYLKGGATWHPIRKV